MSDQVSGQFRKWVGLDIAMEQMVYTVWSVYCKHSYRTRDINCGILCVDNDATLSTYYVCCCYNYNCVEYN